ncbi:SdiA-regulated domain-containing protein [Aequorivita flava]|uniref:SdiA-regulated domain-containing protein n=1 Tax=Aequorivita flava TaxID=3114371 RepID=A0AB35YTS0_9FLAO
MRENKIAFLIIVGVLAFVGILWYAFENPALNPRLEEETYTIIRKWDMPLELNEISGIRWISENRIAAVQDEEGIIFIYNLKTNLVEKKISFGKSGDYEAITTTDNAAYVMESSGRLFEVEDFLSDTFTTNEYQVPFSGRNNMESLVADTLKNRLLFTVKDKDPNSEAYKGIYAFNLETKQTSSLPVLKIPLDSSIFKPKDADDDVEASNNFFPSDMAIHPKTGHYYILEGKYPQMLIMDSLGKPLKLHRLYKESFAQPEGITFAPDGTLYISNEGKNGTANILEVIFNEDK